MNYQVIRTHLSPYQSPHFTELEETLITKLGLKYQTLESFRHEETILITNTHTALHKLPRGVLKNTKLIIHPNSGHDNFQNDLHLLEQIPVVIGHKIRAQAVAEYSIGAVFMHLLELPNHQTWRRERSWERQLLAGSNVWIFGHGHIGTIIADTLATLGMKVTVVDPYIQECPHRHLLNWRDGNLEEARVVIAAMSLNPTSLQLFNEEFFSRANPGLLFINGARGKLVHEESLRAFLLSHPEAYAYLDVFEEEPFKDHWIGFPQVWKTSHIAGVEKNLDRRILSFEEEVLRDFLKLKTDIFKTKYQKELLQNKWFQGVLI
jgi:D-3-phosphoglycerate dehydrogenase